MASGKNLSGVLGIVAAIVVSSFVVGLIFSTNVFSENTLNEWKTDTLCSYTAKSNTTPENSGCIKLSNIVMISSSKNFAFVSTKDKETGGVSLFVIDLQDKNLTNNKFVYDSAVTPIVKYKSMISLTGLPTAICADGNLFAYGTNNYDFALFDGSTRVKGQNLKGKIASCDINGGEVATCAGNNIYVMDEQGNIKWNKEVNGCKNVKILNNNVFATTNDGFFVFSTDGNKIFSKDVKVKDMSGTDKIAIACSDGIYIYNENLKDLNKITDDEAVIGIAGLNKAIAYTTPSTFRIVDYNKSIVYEYAMKPNEQFISISGNKNHAVILTDVKDPDMIVVELSDGKISSIKKNTLDDINNKVKFYQAKDGILIEAFPDNAIAFKNFVGISANESIGNGEEILNNLIGIGAQDAAQEIKDLLEEMKKEYNNANYEKVLEISKNLKAKETTTGNIYASEEKQQTDNLLEMMSDKGMQLTSGTKLKYDDAIEEMSIGKYKEAIENFKIVRRESEQYVRDKVLSLLTDVEKRKAALDKFAESTANITKLDEQINSEKDYVNAFTLLDDVKELENMTKEKTKELFDNTEKAKKEAETPWLIFGADVSDINDKIQEAQIAEDEGDYEKTVKTLSEATKEGKDFDVISKVQDVVVIGIILGVIILIVLIIRRPKVKEE